MAIELGHEGRAALPRSLVAFLEAQSNAQLKGITWVEPDRLRFTAHFIKPGGTAESRVFIYKSALRQSKQA